MKTTNNQRFAMVIGGLLGFGILAGVVTTAYEDLTTEEALPSMAATLIKAEPTTTTTEVAEKIPLVDLTTTTMKAISTTTTTEAPTTTTTEAPTTTTTAPPPPPPPPPTTTQKPFDWVAAAEPWELYLELIAGHADEAGNLFLFGDIQGARRECREGLDVVAAAPLTVTFPDYDLNNYLAQANEAARVLFQGCVDLDVNAINTGSAAFGVALDNAMARLRAAAGL